MKRLAFDTETRGLDAFNPEHRPFLVTWYSEDFDTDLPFHFDPDDKEKLAVFQGLCDEADEIVAHNMTFDAHHMRENYGVDVTKCKAKLVDTDILARIVIPSGGWSPPGTYALKNLSATFVDREAKAPEDQIKSWADEIGVKLKSTGGYYQVYRAYPEAMIEYAEKDAEWTYKLYAVLEKRLEPKEQEVWALECELLKVLINTERHGVAVDQDAVAKLKVEFEAASVKHHETLVKDLGEEALGGKGSEAALTTGLIALGVPLVDRTNTGKLKTDKFTLAKYNKDFPILDTLEDYRLANKILATYVNPTEGLDVIHPSFRQVGAWTGRMSCARPNMQNIPKKAGNELRSMFVPREGYSFIVSDYESIEVRLLAYYLGSEEYRQYIKDGNDPHAWMASKIHGGEPSSYAKGTAGEPLRDVAKNTLFAIIYGAGARKISTMQEITEADAKALIKTIKASLPGYWDLKARIDNAIQARGCVYTLMGRKQSITRDKSYLGLNALIQGTAADIMKKAMVEVAESLPDETNIVLSVHDELVVEVPTKTATATLAVIEDRMTGCADTNPNLTVESKICHNNYSEA